MPTIQAIPAQNDREFTTSIGNWSGDMEWTSNYPVFSSPAAAFSFLPGETEKQMTLNYPAIKIPRSKSLYFAITVGRESGSGTLKATIKISDGAYAYTSEEIIAGFDVSVTVSLLQQIPADWDEKNGSFQLVLQQSIEAEAHVAGADRAFATYGITKIQYLPVTGVG